MSFDLNATSNHFSAAFPQAMTEILLRFQLPPDFDRLGFDQSPAAVYIYDLIDQCNLYCSRSLELMLGYTATEITSMERLGFASLIHPDDLEQVAAHYQRFTTLAEGETIAIQYRMRRADGTWCWLYSQETPLILAVDGFPLQVVGVIQDITNWPNQMHEAANARLRQLDRLPNNLETRPTINLAFLVN